MTEKKERPTGYCRHCRKFSYFDDGAQWRLITMLNELKNVAIAPVARVPEEPGRKLRRKKECVLLSTKADKRGTIRQQIKYDIEVLMHFRGHNASKILRASSHQYVEERAEIYRMLKNRGFSYPRIAALMGRDYSTIIHLLHKHYPHEFGRNKKKVTSEKNDVGMDPGADQPAPCAD